MATFIYYFRATTNGNLDCKSMAQFHNDLIRLKFNPNILDTITHISTTHAMDSPNPLHMQWTLPINT